MVHEAEGKRRLDFIPDVSSTSLLTPKEMLEYCYGLDVNSEQYVDQLTQALNACIHAYILTTSQVRVSQFPNYSLWNVANNYYSAVEQIQDLIQVQMSRIRSGI